MSTQSFPNRLAEGTPGGGRFTFGRFSEPDMTFGHDGVAVDVCPTCDGPSDQDGGIPCSTCLDDTCACGAGLDDGEGYDGQCGSCADRADNEDEADREGEAAAARAIDLHIIDDDSQSEDLLAADSAEPACPECHRIGQHKLGCTTGRQVPPAEAAAAAPVIAPEPERLHPSMGDGPIVTSPSGQYGFYRPINGREKLESIAQHGPIVQVAQLVNGGKAWSPTPSRMFTDDVRNLTPGSQLAIDYGAGWALSAEDTAAFAKYSRQVKAQAAASPAPPATDHDKEIAGIIYGQIGPIVAGNMDAKARNTFAIANGVRMTSCRAGSRKRVDVLVTLNGDDLYDVEVVTTPTLKADSKPVAKTSGIGVSELQGLMLRIGDGRPEAIGQKLNPR